MKNALLFTTLIVLSSLKSISQIVIQEPDIKIPRSTAIATVKDLERYDGLKLQYDLLEKKIGELVKVIQTKDASLNEAKHTESRLNLVISNYNAMQKSDVARYQDMEKKYKREVRAGRFKIVLLGAAGAFILYQTFK